MNYSDQVIKLNDEFDQLSTLGNNEKGLVVVLFNDDLNGEGQEKLGQILQSIQYDLIKDVLVLKMERESTFPIAELKSKHSFSHVISMGLSPSQMGMQIEEHKYLWVKLESFDWLHTDSLAEIMNNKTFKGHLWSCLKEAFLQ